MYLYSLLFKCICVYTYMHMEIFVHMHARICLYECVYIQVRQVKRCVCVCVYKYIYSMYFLYTSNLI